VVELHGLGKHELLTRKVLREWISEGLAGGGNTPGFSSAESSLTVSWKRKSSVGLSGALVVFTGVAVYWAALPPQSPKTSSPPAAQLESTGLPRPHAERAAALRPPRSNTPAGAPTDSETQTVAQYTAQKYQLLLDDLHSPPPDRAQLQRELLLREQLAGQPETTDREKALAEVEALIRGMLHPTDFATYDALKESDLEQFELDDYAGGISNVAPLSAAERKSILRTKLAYKVRFVQLVRDSGLLRAELSPAERHYAYDVASRALNDYLRDYLLEVRQYLANDEQYALLSNYETTKFSAELARLRSRAGES
jgi:hypothetical protein